MACGDIIWERGTRGVDRPSWRTHEYNRKYGGTERNEHACILLIMYAHTQMDPVYPVRHRSLNIPIM